MTCGGARGPVGRTAGRASWSHGTTSWPNRSASTDPSLADVVACGALAAETGDVSLAEERLTAHAA